MQQRLRLKEIAAGLVTTTAALSAAGGVNMIGATETSPATADAAVVQDDRNAS